MLLEPVPYTYLGYFFVLAYVWLLLCPFTPFLPLHSFQVLADRMEVDLPCQRLFFRGKQLENEQTLFDYSINVNDVIQLMIRQPLAETKSENIPITERCDCLIVSTI